MNNNLKIGSHVSMSGNKMLVGSVEEALSYGANAFMIYTGAPQNTKRKPIEELNIKKGLELLEKNSMSSSDIVVHAPYIINLGNAVDSAKFELAVNFLKSEIERTDAIGAKSIVLHPGAHVGEGVDRGIERIIEGLNLVLREDQKATVALETMAGKGTELGRSFEELARIIEGVKLKDKLSVCIDTCHINDAGYDIINDFNGVMEQFDKLIGLDKVSVVHVNDSKNPINSHKDRHENFGFGCIGFETLMKFINFDRFENIPKILETPYVPLTNDKKPEKVPPYKYEIEMIRKGKFDPELIDKIIKNKGI